MDCFAIFFYVLHNPLNTVNFLNIYLNCHFRMTQKKIPMTAASHPKDDVWAQGTVLGAVKLLVRTLGNTIFYNSHFFIASLTVLFDMVKY